MRALAGLRLDLQAEDETVFPAAPVRALHGALHRLLEAVEPALATAVHDASVKPLVLSPLFRASDGAPVGRAVAAGERVWARLAVLEPRTLAALAAALAAALSGARPAGRLDLDGRRFAVVAAMPASPPGSALPPATSYERLAAAATPAPELTLRFASPTVFRHKGRDLLRPEPRLVFGSYLRRWRAFAPAGLVAADEERVAASISLVETRLAVQPVELGDRRQPGFVGWARYRIDGDDPFRTEVAALADYAAYCGTGARTAFGMGQTERIQPDRQAR